MEQTCSERLQELCRRYDCSETSLWIIEEFLKLDPNEQDSIYKFICNVYQHGAAQTADPDENAAVVSRREDSQWKPAVNHNERDEFFAEAGRFLIEKKRASVSLLQRRFRIGFNRAARIMDQLEEAGVIGEEIGIKPRNVLMTGEEFEIFLKKITEFTDS